jgi:KamA family protein
VIGTPDRYHSFTRRHLQRIPQLQALPPSELQALEAVSAVFPFRVSSYVVDELVDWSNIPDDPIYQLTFPQRGMLAAPDFERMVRLVRGGASREVVTEAAREIQSRLNPHPAGQLSMNVPRLDGIPLRGMQHKYGETVLFFPSQGQTCHAYCTYCFRWAQFIGDRELKQASHEGPTLLRYLRRHLEVSDVLFTGGDPMVMSARVLRSYIEPLLDIEHLTSIRIGTKALAYWPYRFTTDRDAGDLLRLFEQVRARGKHLAFMAHFSHPREVDTPAAEQAMRRIVDTGATIRCQAPLIRNVNDDPDAWADMWRLQVRNGAVPYYMFVERDTGAKEYFEVPLVRAFDIYETAIRKVSGLARTARGPSMSATPGKVLVDGIATVSDEDVFVLKMLQGRDPRWANRVFFAKLDPDAAWLDDLEPAFDEEAFFYEAELERMQRGRTQELWAEEGLASFDDDTSAASFTTVSH